MPIVFFIIILSILSPLIAADPPLNPVTSAIPHIPEVPAPMTDNLSSLDNLIEVTQQHLEKQKQIRTLLQEYLQIRQRYLANMDDDNLGLQMVRLGNQLSSLTIKHHLTHLFDQELLNELNVCAQIANKK